MSRCYVCNALPHDGCNAIDGEIAECPRPSAVMVAEARKALEAHGRGDLAAYLVHQANARRIADSLGLSARPQREEVAA